MYSGSKEPVTKQPHKPDWDRSSPQPDAFDECSPADCCCPCLFLYLLCGYDTHDDQRRDKMKSYESAKKKDSDQNVSSYCYFNNLSDDAMMPSWSQKGDQQDDDDGWLAAAASSSSNNESNYSNSPLSDHGHKYESMDGHSDNHDNNCDVGGGDTGGDCGGD